MDDLESISESHISPVWTRYTSIVAERAEGAYVYDRDGTRYLDFTCGIGVTNTGHCHPKVVRAVQEQAAKLLHGQANIIFHPPLLELAEELRTVVPEELDCFFLSNSGAEAVEGAIKLARHATARPNVIVFQGSFHGRTALTMALTTSKTIYRAGYQPLPAGVFVAPYPYTYRYGWGPEETEVFCLREVEFLLMTQTAPCETAAILVEPVLGEGGYVVPPPGFLKGLRRICDEHSILLIADEVQSGFGRTGKWFAVEHFGVVPDIMVMAKGLASGLPLSGVAARRELMERWVPGSHGGTYGGNAIACAAAVATIRTIREEGLLENARQSGAWLMEQLRALQAEFSIIGDVRGLGLMIGVEFTAPDGSPATDLAKALGKGCLKRHLLLLTCGPWSNTVRWIPPLTVTREQMEEALTTFKDALAEAVA
ncbi:MAG: aminotransferase class III-fold pyridoxal phosphate-dependent enzyme [Chloroflexi bacterium]|jgi:4-aminobutyrate aminotransferase|nr:aminotransferase class III-fold pyridoxal phosphate-dependent enzyme [Chloroflexota bacterium]